MNNEMVANACVQAGAKRKRKRISSDEEEEEEDFFSDFDAGNLKRFSKFGY